MRFMKHIGIMAASLALFAGTGYAAVEGEEVAGVPAYSVTRLKIFEGSAWVRTPDSGDWEEFSSNSPVPVRSLISIPEGSEAELQFHGGQYVLLTSGTELSVRGLENDRITFGLRSGEIRFYLPETDFAPVRVTTPGGGRTEFPVPGRYWLIAADSGETTLVVREGEGTVFVERGAFPVKAGEQALIGEDVRIAQYAGGERDTYEEPPPLSDSEKQAGVPPAAAHELREYGEWVHSSEYGYVWRPRVSAGWSPYYYGRWTWISPYGWTWISYEPWGWYPYHYGYWYTDPVFGWVWYPFHSFLSLSFSFGHYHYPHYHRHAYYYPARVRFVRDGRRVRWVPLRPGERTGRIAYTRSDPRLASWERPLSRGTVYMRGGRAGEREWRDWTAVRRERREAVRATGAPAPVRRGEGPNVRTREGTRPVSRERAVDPSVRGRGERPKGNIRNTAPPARERPARPERWQRESPPSPRPGRRSEPRIERSRETDRAERYGNRLRERVAPRVYMAPARAVRQSPPVTNRTNRRLPALQGRGMTDDGRVLNRGTRGTTDRRDAGTGVSKPQSRPSSRESPGRIRGDAGRGSGRGGYTPGSRGGRGGRSIR